MLIAAPHIGRTQKIGETMLHGFPLFGIIAVWNYFTNTSFCTIAVRNYFTNTSFYAIAVWNYFTSTSFCAIAVWIYFTNTLPRAARWPLLTTS